MIDRSTVAQAEDAGFYDSGSLHVGDSWKDGLTDALKSCGVFVYVHSEPYFRTANAFCGKEWWVFRGRVEVPVTGPKLYDYKPIFLLLKVY